MIETGIQLDEKLPLYEKVAGKISFLIEQGTLRPGDKVPSIRNLSKQMHVSINTVKEAYSLLEDRRLLEARPQSGYYVRARLPELPAEPVVDRPTINPAEVSLSKIYQEVMMDYNDQNLLQLGIATPNIALVICACANRSLNDCCFLVALLDLIRSWLPPAVSKRSSCRCAHSANRETRSRLRPLFILIFCR